MQNETEKKRWITRVVDIVASKLEVANAKAASEINTYEKVFGNSWKRNFEKGVDQYETGTLLYNEILKLA